MVNYSSDTTELDKNEKYGDFTLAKGWKGWGMALKRYFSIDKGRRLMF